MKNYFNQKERTNHIILLAMGQVVENLIESTALTKEEMQALKLTKKHIDNFHKLVFERFGLPYKKKIENTMQVNKLGLYSKYGQEKNCISYCASEDVYKMGKFLRNLQCFDCEKCNHLDCGVYAMLCAVESDTNEEESGCPYKF
jgi:hypothetical protein